MTKTKDGGPTRRFSAVLRDEKGRETPLGTVALDSAGMMSVEGSSGSAKGSGADKLRRMVDEVNAAKVLHIDVAPREDAPEFTLASAIIKRGDPQFVDALKEQARTYYGIELSEP